MVIEARLDPQVNPNDTPVKQLLEAISTCFATQRPMEKYI